MADIFVGSVSVGVVPDLRDFNNRMRDGIVPGADSVGREYGARLAEGIRASIRDGLREAFTAKINADTGEATAGIDKMRAEQERRPVKLKVDVDKNSIDSFGKKLTAGIANALKFASKNLGIGLLGGSGLFAGVSALVGLISPLTALTGAFGAFALVAVPEITKVSAALSKTGTAAKTAWAQLTPSQRQLAVSLKAIEASFRSLQREVSPEVDSILSLGAGLVKDLLPSIRILAIAGSDVIASFIRPLDAWVRSGAFFGLTVQFAQAAVTIGKVLGPQLVQLAKTFAQLFIQTMPNGTKLLEVLIPLLIEMVKSLTPAINLFLGWTAATIKWLTQNHLLIPILAAVAFGLTAVTGGLVRVIAGAVAAGLAFGYLATHWSSIWHDIIHGLDVFRHDWAYFWDSIFSNTVGRFLRFQHDMQNNALQFRHDFAKVFDDIRHDVAGIWDAGWRDVTSIASSAWHGILHGLDIFWNSITGGFRSTVNTIGRVWGTIEGIFKAPVSFLVNTVYDNGIARLWNDVMTHIGGPKLPIIHFASGGRVPGWGGGDIQPALLEPGETVVSKETSRWLAPMFRAAGVPGYQGGGVIGSIGSAIGGLFGGIGDVLKIVTALVTGNSTAADNAFSHLFHTPAHGDLATMMLGIPRKIVDTGVHFVISEMSKLLGPGGGAGGKFGPIGGGVGRYAGLAREVLAMLGQPVGDYTIVLSQMTTESGGNPYAINRWDSNWLAGTPSVGLMQVIGPTFAANAGPFRNTGPFAYGVSENPLANTFAGMHYAVGRYGSAPGGWTDVLGHGHGYDRGGWWPSGTFGWNTSGKTELVMTGDQVATAMGGGDQYIVNLDNMTQTLENEVVRAFDRIQIQKGLVSRAARRN